MPRPTREIILCDEIRARVVNTLQYFDIYCVIFMLFWDIKIESKVGDFVSFCLYMNAIYFKIFTERFDSRIFDLMIFKTAYLSI